MLCLSRKENERILVGDDIVIEVVRIGGGVVRLGVSAPRNMIIIREELFRAKPDETSAPEESQPETAHANQSQ